VLPLLFVFLPRGFDLVPALGVLLAGVSIAVQSLGAFAYDHRWERLYQRPALAGHPELWNPLVSPLVFHAREHVLVLARPSLRDALLVVREHRLVPFGPRGARIAFDDGLVVSGGEPTFGDAHLQAGARVSGKSLLLKSRADGLFLRVLPGGQA